MNHIYRGKGREKGEAGRPSAGIETVKSPEPISVWQPRRWSSPSIMAFARKDSFAFRGFKESAPSLTTIVQVPQAAFPPQINPKLTP